jgi:hypothetical protein
MLLASKLYDQSCKSSYTFKAAASEACITHVLPTGFKSMRSSVGGSVASASAPRVSMIRFTHNNCQNSNTQHVKTQKITNCRVTFERCTSYTRLILDKSDWKLEDSQNIIKRLQVEHGGTNLHCRQRNISSCN